MSIIFPPKYANFGEKETIFLENLKIETFGEFTKGFVVEPWTIQGLILYSKNASYALTFNTCNFTSEKFFCKLPEPQAALAKWVNFCTY